ncbi:hypothetical protein P692DRAFT_20224400 [Suillus brevipes Sb2]|nr:hypothetical protein P692DRAFT_20224400 [Suillus brevipes Sb2]
MSKPNCTPKPRRHHDTFSLPMPQHPRRLLLQVQQPHNHHPSYGGLKSCCFTAVHLHHNTASIAAFGQLLHPYFALIFLPLFLSIYHYFLVVKLVLCIEPNNDTRCRRRTVCFAGFSLSLLLFSPLGFCYNDSSHCRQIRERHHNRETACSRLPTRSRRQRYVPFWCGNTDLSPQGRYCPTQLYYSTIDRGNYLTQTYGSYTVRLK